MLEFVPTFIIIAVTAACLSRLRAAPTTQIFILIVVAYTAFFPAVDFALSPYPPIRIFPYHQSMFGIFFLFPLLLFIMMQSKSQPVSANSDGNLIKLNHYIPFILSANAALFLIASVRYNLFFVRLGYSDFLETADSTPVFLLYHNRLAIETSFFLIIYLASLVRYFPKDRYVNYYRLTLYLYIVVFGVFFLINSRMQFLLLGMLLLTSNYRSGFINFRALFKIIIISVVVVISLTLLREFIIEKNHRLDASSTFLLMKETIWLIAARLNSVTMVDLAGESGYSAFVPHLSGLAFIVKFNLSPIFDPSYYDYMKSIQITSPSVFVMNDILIRRDVDFPKSMMVEFLLIFGLFGLPFLAFILSRIVSKIQLSLKKLDPSDTQFILALYLLPLLLQFEKEFSGFLLSALKWTPMLIFIIATRPKRVQPSPATGSRELG